MSPRMACLHVHSRYLSKPFLVPRLLWILLLLTTACTLHQNKSTSSEVTLHDLGFNGQISGGYKAWEASPIARSTVLVSEHNSRGDEYSCTGVLLREDVVLTAAHCVTDEGSKRVLPTSSVSVYDSYHGFEKIYAKRIRVPKFYIEHLKFTHLETLPSFFTDGYDIAILQLERPLPSPYQPAFLATDFADVWKESLLIAGYGGHNSESPNNDGQLRTGKITLDPNHKASDVVFAAAKGGDKHIVPGPVVNAPWARLLEFKKNASDAALHPGDSGGPLYFEKNHRVYLVAINSQMALEGTGVEDAVLLFGENLYLLSRIYLEMTGEALLSSPPANLEKEAGYFESHFSALAQPASNQLLDLSTQMAIPTDGKNEKFQAYFLISTKDGENPCVLINNAPEGMTLLDVSLPKEAEKGATLRADLLAVTYHQNSLDVTADYEARFKTTETSLQTVVSTSAGFVSAEIPIRHCHDENSEP